MTRLASGPVAPTTCGGTLPSAFKTPPALLALIDAQVIGRKRMPLSAAAWDTIQPDPAQIGSREGDDHAAFSVERAPASSGGVVRNAQHDNATVILRRIVPDISEIQVPRQQRFSSLTDMRCDLDIRSGPQPDIAR